MKESHKEHLKIFGDDLYLHGSRGMADRCFFESHPDVSKSDWDYATQNRIDWVATRNGWVQVVDQSYTDNDTMYVYEKIIDGDKIQVSERVNLKRYMYVFNSILPEFYFKYLWKGSDKCLPVEDRRNFYNNLYGLYDLGVEVGANPNKKELNGARIEEIMF
jgi:hypothetical protein